MFAASYTTNSNDALVTWQHGYAMLFDFSSLREMAACNQSDVTKLNHENNRNLRGLVWKERYS